MQKKIGAILLIAGTCIGSGMIALPMVLAKLGIGLSIVMMLSIWYIMYVSSLINLELNLQADEGLPLGKLGEKFSGRGAKWVCIASLKLLTYSLLAVYISGASSIFRELMSYKMHLNCSLTSMATVCALFGVIVLLLPFKCIDYFNRLLFIGLLIVVGILITGLTVSLNWSHIPLVSEQYHRPSTWMALIPVIFTSFGFSVVFSSLTNYCNKNAKMLKQVFFWGSFIPACVYILWTCVIVAVVYYHNPVFYHKMVHGNVEVGELIQVLSRVAKWESIQLLIWGISLLAIATSLIGVGIGLFDSFKAMLAQTVRQPALRRLLTAGLTMGPPYLAVLFVPNAFIAVLGFAGMILALMAILMPVYLFWKMNASSLFFEELRKKWLVSSTIAAAVVVIACELCNMM